MTIRNPIEWSLDQLRGSALAVGSAGRAIGHIQDNLHSPSPAVARIGTADLKDVLVRGAEDFAACRTDVVFLCVAYPVLGLVFARLAFGYNLVPLLFPLASGFALVGPLAAVGLYEMSRRRERGLSASWVDAFGIVRAPSFGSIALLGLVLMAIFVLWLVAAEAIYKVTLGPDLPASIPQFLHDVIATPAGWTMIGVGVGVGFLFALLVLSISVVSFSLLLDRQAGIDTAVRTSVRAVLANPGPMALWGLIVVGGLILGSIPLFVGLVIVMPVLGHATWHLYRKLVPPEADRR